MRVHDSARPRRTAGGIRTDATMQRGRRGEKLSWRDAGSSGTREGARRRRGQPVATAIVPVGRRTERRKTATSVRFRAPELDSCGGEVQLGEAELVAVTARFGVAGVDGDARGTAAGWRRSQELARARSRSGNRGAGDGERE